MGPTQPCMDSGLQLGGGAADATLQGPRRMLLQAAAPPQTAPAVPSPDGNDPPTHTPIAHLKHASLAEAVIAQHQHERADDATRTAEVHTPQLAAKEPHETSRAAGQLHRLAQCFRLVAATANPGHGDGSKQPCRTATCTRVLYSGLLHVAGSCRQRKCVTHAAVAFKLIHTT